MKDYKIMKENFFSIIIFNTKEYIYNSKSSME